MKLFKESLSICTALIILLTTFAVDKSYAIDLPNEPIQPLDNEIQINQKKAKLGELLFNETKLSSDNSVSCASCHNLAGAGADNKAVSPGVNNTVGTRNSPTVFNAVYNFKQFWDGRANTLAEQAAGPITDPVEMGSKWPDVIDTLTADPVYKKYFDDVYGEISETTVTDAIAEFEKTLITTNSPFDKFLLGDANAIDENQKRGYELFKSYGCSSCHQGKNVGGNMFQKFGVLKDINLRKNKSSDLGRYKVTGNQWDKHVFKVPSLRLAVLTAPYFHDGSIDTIEDAVDIMIEFQLGREVPDKDRNDIITFLKSLVGEYQGVAR